jgi:hypothetical protein
MKEILISIIEECAENNIPVSVFKDKSKGTYYEVSGFSKSGIATLYISNGKIICETRYETLDEIENFHELSLIAFEWYMNYKNRSPFENPEKYWAEYWVKKGLMKKELITVYSLI